VSQSQLDFLADGDDDEAGQAGESFASALTERRIVFEKEKPLLAAELVEVANPNSQQKQNVKAKDLDLSDAPPTLSRRER
jgi:hypothetical protein